MHIEATTVDQYVDNLPEDRKSAINQLRKTILEHLPQGFVECLSYGMIGYVVPQSIYPSGYRCDPTLPLPFINVASQKNFIVIHHMGLYADSNLKLWFENEYPNHSKQKMDMGKACVRFKKFDQIPFDLIGELSGKVSVEDWIHTYESKFLPQNLKPQD